MHIKNGKAPYIAVCFDRKISLATAEICLHWSDIEIQMYIFTFPAKISMWSDKLRHGFIFILFAVRSVGWLANLCLQNIPDETENSAKKYIARHFFSQQNSRLWCQPTKPKEVGSRPDYWYELENISCHILAKGGLYEMGRNAIATLSPINYKHIGTMYVPLQPFWSYCRFESTSCFEK